MINNKVIEAKIYLYLFAKMVTIQVIAIAKRLHIKPISISSESPVTIAPIAITTNKIFSTILKTSLIA